MGIRWLFIWYFIAMKTRMDSAGRIVIPKQIRTQAHLDPSTALEIHLRDGVVEIHAPLPEVRWVAFKGIEFPEIDAEGLNSDQIRSAIESSRDSSR